MPSPTRTAVAILWAAVCVSHVTTHAADQKKQREKPSDEQLAGIHVFYAEPPFAYEPTEEIEIKVRTTWTRAQIEDRIREKVGRAGGDIIVVGGSVSKLDGRPRAITRPWGNNDAPDMAIQMPARSFYVVGAIGRLPAGATPLDNDRTYTLDSESIWNALPVALEKMGLEMQSIDEDSRYLVSAPGLAARALMECDDAGPSDSAFALTVYVRTYREITRVRVESDFIDAHTGAPSGCRSTGAYERSFFRQLETGLQ